jgi:hypothetical protein
MGMSVMMMTAGQPEVLFAVTRFWRGSFRDSGQKAAAGQNGGEGERQG